MDKIIFGDNQFFGINHMSEEKARAQAMRFQDSRAIIDVLDMAYDEGIRTFMCTTHEKIAEICDHVRANRQRYADFRFYPCMPYAHKYANAATELGLFEALRQFLPTEGKSQALLKGGVSIARKDIEGLAQLLIDAEMKMFEGLPTPVVFLQNVVTDMLLGLGMYEALHMFASHVRSAYQAEPGFITMNLPKLLDVLDELKIDNPIVCANINKRGFRMCGGKEAYENAIATRRFRPVAMSVFASGALSANEALEYICQQKNIRAFVFGASSRQHIRQTKYLFEELCLGTDADQAAPPAGAHTTLVTGE